jgi:hypothetical protein
LRRNTVDGSDHLGIEKLCREVFGRRSERKARLFDQLELRFEDLGTDATEHDLAAEQSARFTLAQSIDRKRL